MPTTLVTSRLRLRPWVESDVARYRQLWLQRDPRSLRVIGPDGRPTEEDLRARIREQLAVSAATGIALFVVERRNEPGLLGYCGLIDRPASPGEPELAYELLREAWHQGFATEAGRAVVDAAAATGRARLWAGVRAWNAASLRVLARLGFEPSGRVERDAERGDMITLSRELHRPG